MIAYRVENRSPSISAIVSGMACRTLVYFVERNFLIRRSPSPLTLQPQQPFLCYASGESALFEPSKGLKMAKREHQMPDVLRQEGPRPYWVIRYRIRELDPSNGTFKRKEKWHRLGYCDEIEKREAKRMRDEIMREVNNQVFTLSDQVLFRDFVARYTQKHFPTLASGPRRKYESLLKNHILPAFGSKRLCDVTTEDVQAFLNGKQESLSWWSRNDLKGILQGIYTKAADWGYWHRKNPVLRTSLGKMRLKRWKFCPTDEQVCDLINELPCPVSVAVALTVSTGMRASEVCGLRWENVDFNSGWIHVCETFYRGEAGTGKTEKSDRSVHMGRMKQDLLGIRPMGAQPADYVFQIGGRPMDDRYILRRYIKPAAKRLGLCTESGFGWRTFRRLNITAIQEGADGVNVFEAMAQAGHTKPETTMKYVLLSSSNRERAVLRVQDRLIPRGNAGIMRESEELLAS